MTDQTTKQPLSVSANGTTVPYLMVPVTQVEVVEADAATG